MLLKQGYKQTEGGVIPEDWELVPLEDISAFITKGATPTTYGFKWERSGILFLRSECVSENGLDLTQSMFISPKAHLVLRRSEVCDGDILVTITGNVGRVVWLMGVGNANLNQHIARVRITDVNADSRYVYQYLSQPLIRQKFNSITTGQAYPQLSLQQIRDAKVAFPPAKEQHAIAAALSDVDALLAAQDKLIAKKHDIKQAAMQRLLTGKQRLSGFTGEWEVKRLEDICWYQEGPGVRNYQFTKQGVKLLNGTNLVNGKVALDTTNRYISEEEAFGVYSHFLVDDGDILIASSGVTIDKFHEKVAFASSEHLPLCMNTSTIRFKPNPTELLDKYLYFFLQSDLFKEPIGKQATGSAQLNFGPAHLNNIVVNLPPTIEEQTFIATILSDMDADLGVLEQQRDKTRALKQGMMQELLTGRIRLV